MKYNHFTKHPFLVIIFLILSVSIILTICLYNNISISHQTIQYYWVKLNQKTHIANWQYG